MNVIATTTKKQLLSRFMNIFRFNLPFMNNNNRTMFNIHKSNLNICYEIINAL